MLADPFYARYGAHLEAPADIFDDLVHVQIVATTPVTAGEEPSALDLCHYDIVVEAEDEAQLRERIEAYGAGSPATAVDRWTPFASERTLRA